MSLVRRAAAPLAPSVALATLVAATLLMLATPTAVLAASPTVTIEQSAGQADPATTWPVTFEVVFSESVTGFDAADVVVTGIDGPVTISISGSGATYAVDVSASADDDATVVASIPAGAALNGALEPSLASTSTDNTVLVDASRPTLTIDQAPGQTDPTDVQPIEFDLVFSEPVTGFDIVDVITGFNPPSDPTTALTGSGATYRVSVYGLTATTPIQITIEAGAAVDAAGNPSLAATAIDDTVTYDLTPPTVTVDQMEGQLDPTDTEPISFAVQFAEVVVGFDAEDVILSGTAGATTVDILTIANGFYVVYVSGMTGPGSVIASIPAGAVTDLMGYPNEASTSTDNVVTFAVAPAPTATPTATPTASPTPTPRPSTISPPPSDTATPDAPTAGSDTPFLVFALLFAIAPMTMMVALRARRVDRE